MRAARELLMVAPLVLVLDQWSKDWLIHGFQIAARSPYRLCEYFSLVMAWNRGVSFSMFSSGATWAPYALIGLAVLVSGVLARLALRAPTRRDRLGYALVIGGALSNALDRVRFGAVADFFYAHVGELGWPAFNVADMAICLGVGLLMLGAFGERSEKLESKKQE